MEGTRPPSGASPTQPYKCGQNVKVKVKTAPAPSSPYRPLMPPYGLKILACAEINKFSPYTIHTNAVLANA